MEAGIQLTQSMSSFVIHNVVVQFLCIYTAHTWWKWEKIQEPVIAATCHPEVKVPWKKGTATGPFNILIPKSGIPFQSALKICRI